MGCQETGDLGQQEFPEITSPAPGEKESPRTHPNRLRGVSLESSFSVEALSIVENTKRNIRPWANRGDPSFLLSPGESTPGALCPGLGSPAQERQRCTEESPVKSHKDA